jgi:cyclic beta-1,2-glucan synthetase
MYQAAIRYLMGLRRNGATLSVYPCIPAIWPECSLDWRIGQTRYRFTILNPASRSHGIAMATFDGVSVEASAIPLVEDGGEHEVTITLGTRATAATVGFEVAARSNP